MPYGSDRSANALLNRSAYKYTDQEQDAGTGLYNYDARLYDPVLGQFVMADTIVPEPFNPQSLNRYAYCLNNPERYVDPTGHGTQGYAGYGHSPDGIDEAPNGGLIGPNAGNEGSGDKFVQEKEPTLFGLYSVTKVTISNEKKGLSFSLYGDDGCAFADGLFGIAYGLRDAFTNSAFLKGTIKGFQMAGVVVFGSGAFVAGKTFAIADAFTGGQLSMALASWAGTPQGQNFISEVQNFVTNAFPSSTPPNSWSGLFGWAVGTIAHTDEVILGL